MKSLFLSAPLLVLAACNAQPKTEVIDNNPDPMANQLATAPKAELPPAIRADKTFRCTDGSVVGVAFFQGDTLVNVRIPSDAAPVRLTAPAKGEPFVADGGWKLTGDEDAINVTSPGKASLSCHT